MDDAQKSREELLAELGSLRARVAELEKEDREQRRAETKSEWEVTHDELTGLFDRRHFLERLTPIVRSAVRYRYPVSVSVCQVDGVEALSEEKGRVVVDELLAEFGGLVLDELRGEDLAGRYADSVFCLCFPHTTAIDAATPVRRLRTRLAKMTGDLPIVAAFGVADLECGATTAVELLDAAVQALDRARAADDAICIVQAP